jgi:lysophospholipid acyltransferase (LPLAT)-like uncharacterized protein
VRLGERIALWSVPRVAAIWIRLLRASMRIRHLDRAPLDAIDAGDRPYIHAFWHDQLLLMPYAYRGRGITILISRHRDGEYIARTMERFGFHTTRGSSTRGGARGLLAAVRRVREGYDLGITPDGPRGPRHRVQAGVIEAARLTGCPILPVTFACSRAWRLRSWDRFLVPKPFGRGAFVYGTPLSVPRSAPPPERERLRERLEAELEALTARAEAAVAGRGRRTA